MNGDSKTSQGSALPSPLLAAGGSGAPWSDRFDDTYFDQDDGLIEAQHVFLNGCGLPESWAEAPAQPRFIVGELGFGTGLNFLATWQLWRQSKHPPATLHFVSVEGFPLMADEIENCLFPWPDLAPLRLELVRNYPNPHPGIHRVFLEDGHIVLTLVFGQIEAALQSLELEADAWFLDGFAPAKNQDMWQTDIFSEVARLSHSKTRIATFTVAGEVRRNLSAAGFALEKRGGVGRKREVLSGIYYGDKTSSRLQPWYASPPALAKSKPSIVIIGAGLAGAHTAYAFGRRGHAVTVFEHGTEIASAASSVPNPVTMPRLSVGDSVDGSFYATAWPTAVRTMAKLRESYSSNSNEPCGVLHVASSATELERLEKICDSRHLHDASVQFVDAKTASKIANISISYGGLFFPEGGLVEQVKLCHALLNNADLRLNQSVSGCKRVDSHWVVHDSVGQILAAADIVVLANSLGARQFSQASHLPLSARLGQLSYLSETDCSKALTCVLAGEGHITPSMSGQHIVGATFDHVDYGYELEPHPKPTMAADAYNRDLANNLAPGLFGQDASVSAKGWTGLRCTTPDHLPIAGPLPDHDAYLKDYSDLHHGRHWKDYPEAQYHQGLFVLTGLGARGTVTAPIAAELIACQALGEPLPLSPTHIEALHPGRFLIRAMKQAPR